MLLGDYHSGNFWSSVFRIMQLQAGWQAVAILYIEIVYVSMGNALHLFNMFSLKIRSACIPSSSFHRFIHGDMDS